MNVREAVEAMRRELLEGGIEEHVAMRLASWIALRFKIERRAVAEADQLRHTLALDGQVVIGLFERGAGRASMATYALPQGLVQIYVDGAEARPVWGFDEAGVQHWGRLLARTDDVMLYGAVDAAPEMMPEQSEREGG